MLVLIVSCLSGTRYRKRQKIASSLLFGPIAIHSPPQFLNHYNTVQEARHFCTLFTFHSTYIFSLLSCGAISLAPANHNTTTSHPLNQLQNINTEFSTCLQYDHKRIKQMSDRLVNGIMSATPHVIRNGDPENTYSGCVNLSFAYVEGESLLMALKDVALSSGR